VPTKELEVLENPDVPVVQYLPYPYPTDKIKRSDISVD